MSFNDHQKNRVAWNEMVEVHIKHPSGKLKEFLSGWCSLKEIELNEVGDVSGKTLLHLMCQYGLDSLSWAKRGAKVFGVDISDNSIDNAKMIKEKSKIENASFIREDVLKLQGAIKEKFEIVFQSYGTHVWISDIYKWAEVVASYLLPGGFLYIIDQHPICVIYQTQEMTYFSREPQRYKGENDYLDRQYKIKNELVEWQHPLSEIINAVIKSGLSIEFVHEFDKGFYQVEDDWYQEGDYWYPPGGPCRYPLMFSLKAHKPQ